ncbi:helix-turn-helix transcriptional regulator [Methylobacterium sp. A54F]
MGEKCVTPAQCRAGRALLGWTREELAAAAQVSKMTLADFETGKRNPYERTLRDIADAFEAAGVLVFRATDEVGSGVRFKDPST